MLTLCHTEYYETSVLHIIHNDELLYLRTCYRNTRVLGLCRRTAERIVLQFGRGKFDTLLLASATDDSGTASTLPRILAFTLLPSRFS